MLNLADEQANPAWRWNKALDVQVHKLPVYRVDKLTQEVVTYLDLCEIDVRMAKDKMPLMAFAHDLYVSTKKHRAMYEAALLCRQSLDQVTAEYCLKRGQIKMYHSIFFEVIPRIDKEAWIYSSVFSDLLGRARILEFNQEEFWKYLAYNCTYPELWSYYKMELMSDTTNQKFMGLLRGQVLKCSLINTVNIRPSNHMAAEMMPILVKAVDEVAEELGTQTNDQLDILMKHCQISPQFRNAQLPSVEYPGQHADIKQKMLEDMSKSE